MGAGVSAFAVPILMGAHQAVADGLLPTGMEAPVLVLLLILSAFNLLNLLPMHRFDGGQVLRQLFAGRAMQTLTTFTVTSAIVWTGWRIGLSSQALIAGLSVFALLSLIRTRKVKPRLQLEAMNQQQRLMTGAGFCAALSIHVGGLIYACDRLFTTALT